MMLQTVAIVGLLVSGSLCGILNPRQVGSSGNGAYSNTSSTVTESLSPLVSYSSSEEPSDNHGPTSSAVSSTPSPPSSQAVTDLASGSSEATNPSSSLGTIGSGTTRVYSPTTSDTSSSSRAIPSSTEDEHSLSSSSFSGLPIVVGITTTSIVTSVETDVTTSDLQTPASSLHSTVVPTASSLSTVDGYTISISGSPNVPNVTESTTTQTYSSTFSSNSITHQGPTNVSSAVDLTTSLPASNNVLTDSAYYATQASGLLSTNVSRSSSQAIEQSHASGPQSTVTGGGYNKSSTVAPAGLRPSGSVYSTTITSYTPVAPFPLSHNTTSNGSSCGGATINIPEATLNWWYSREVNFAAATFSALYNYNDTYTGWTLLEATTTFDVASALAAPTSSSSTMFNTYVNESLIYFYEYTTPTPRFPSTTVITQAATVPLNVSAGSGTLPANVITTPPPASAVVPGPSSAALTALTNTPFVYFSEFAVDSEQPTKAKNGASACVTSREIHTLQSPFALYYGDEDPDGQSEVTGELPADFLGELSAMGLPLSQVKLGTYAAKPTLLVVVEEVYAAEAVLAAHTELSQSALVLPSPKAAPSDATIVAATAAASFITLSPAHVESTESSLLVPSPTGNGNFIRPTGVDNIAHTELSQQNLLVPSPTPAASVDSQIRLPEITGTVRNPTIIPFTADIGNTQVTFLAPENTEGTITTTAQGGIIITAGAATATGNPDTGPGSGSLGSGVQGSGSGSGSGNNPAPAAQQSQDLSNLFSAIQGVGQSAGIGSEPSAGSAPGSQNVGSSSGESSSEPLENVGSEPGANQGQSGSGNAGSSGTGVSDTPNNIAVAIPVDIGGVQTSVGPSSNLLFGSQTVSPGGPVVTISGTPISLGPNGVVIGGVTQTFASPSPTAGTNGQSLEGSGTGEPSVITFGDATITAAPVPVIIISGQTLEPGQTGVLNNKAISFDTNNALVVDGSTMTMAIPSSPTDFAAAGGTIKVGLAPAFLIDGKTLLAGGTAVNVGGTQLSLAPSATALIVDGSVTSVLASHSTDVPLALTVGSNVFTANAATQFLLGSTITLVPGGQATVSGTTLRLAPGGSVAVVNGVSQTLSPAMITPAPILTYGGTAYEANLGSTFEVAGQELTPGGAITVHGTRISLNSDASALVVDGVTQTLATRTPSATTPAPTRAAVLTLGGKTYTAGSGSTFVIDGSTLTPGGMITLGSGNSASTISLGLSGTGSVVADGVTSGISLGLSPDSQTAALQDLTVGGQTFSAGPSGEYLLSGQTLIPGGSAVTFTAQGSVETVSLNPAGNVLVVNGASSTLAAPRSGITPGPLTVNGQVYNAVDGSGGLTYVISGQTLTKGGAITFSDGAGVEIVSLSPNGVIAVINGMTSSIAPAPTITAAPELTVDGQIITAAVGSGTTYLISGKMLTPGGSVVFEGPNGMETVSLSPDGSTLVEAVSGAVTTSALPTAFGVAQTAAPVITIGQNTFTALPGAVPSYLLPDGQTLRPGGPALTETISGRVYVVTLSPKASVLIVEDVGPGGVVTRTQVETLFPATVTRPRGTATLVVGADGAATSSTQTRSIQAAQPTSDPAGLQAIATLDKKIAGSLVAGAFVIALLAMML